MWNEEDPEDEVLAMVVRTGLCTTMGSMLRQVMNPLQEGIGTWATDPFLPVSSLAMLRSACLLMWSSWADTSSSYMGTIWSRLGMYMVIRCLQAVLSDA